MLLSTAGLMAAALAWGGVNYADAFNAAMTLIGSALVLGGAGFLLRLANIRVTATSPQVQKRSVS